MKAVVIIFSIILIINIFNSAHTLCPQCSANTQCSSCGANTQCTECFQFHKQWFGDDVYETPDNGNYRYLSVSSITRPQSGCISFVVRAKNDAHFVLKNLDEYVVEIYLSNTDTLMRKFAGHTYSNAKITNVISETCFSGFWINWNKGTVNVGRAGETKSILTATEPYLLPVHFMGFRTINGAKGTWALVEPNCPGFNQSVPNV